MKFVVDELEYMIKLVKLLLCYDEDDMMLFFKL